MFCFKLTESNTELSQYHEDSPNEVISFILNLSFIISHKSCLKCNVEVYTSYCTFGRARLYVNVWYSVAHCSDLTRNSSSRSRRRPVPKAVPSRSFGPVILCLTCNKNNVDTFKFRTSRLVCLHSAAHSVSF